MKTTKKSSLRNANEARARTAEKEASEMLPLIQEIQALGQTSLRSIAGELNQRGITTSSGSLWHPNSIKRVLDRVGDGEPKVEGKFGRALKGDPAVICRWRADNQASIAETARHFGIGTATVNRYLLLRKIRNSNTV